MSDFLSIGHSTTDVYTGIPDAHLHRDETIHREEVCLLWGQKYVVENIDIGVGGNAVNVAVGLTKLGVSTGLVSAAGKDFFGAFVRAALKNAGVSLQYVQSIARTDTSIILSFENERTLIGYRGDEPYHFPSLPEAEVPKWLFVTSVGFSNYGQMYAEVLQFLEAHPQVLVAYNPGTRELQAKEHIDNLLTKVNLLFVNVEEAGLIVGKPDLVSTATNLDVAISESIPLFKEKGVKMVVVTAGEQGAYGYDGLDVYHQPPFPTNIVEKTGAGDAFTSGVLAGMWNGHGLAESLRWGAAQSAHAMQVTGAARGLLNATQMAEVLKAHTSIQPRKIKT